MNYFLGVLGVLLFKAAHAQSEQVVALAGGDVILPCSLKASSSDDLQTLEWSKKDLVPNVVFLYRDGCETFEMKNVDFEYRASLVMRELNNGNTSLRISNLKLSDAGTYRCLKILKNGTREETTVDLDVVAVSDLKLAVVPADTFGVTVECEARCCSPVLEIKILDGEGNDISGERETEEPETGGCFRVKLKVTLQNPTSRVVCRVYQPTTNQSITAEMPIPGFGMSSSSIVWISVLSIVTLCLVTVTIILRLRRKACFKSGKKKLSIQSSASASENSSMLGDEPPLHTETENALNKIIERLSNEVASLESENRVKDETIRQLQNQSPPLQCGVLSQLNQPTTIQSPSKSSLDSSKTPNPSPHLNSESRKLLPKPEKPSKKKGPKADKERKNSHTGPGRPLQSKHRNRSSPSLETSAPPELNSTVCNKMKDPVVHLRSQSDPVTHSGPKTVYQRKSFSGSPSLFNNRFLPLAED